MHCATYYYYSMCLFIETPMHGHGFAGYKKSRCVLGTTVLVFDGKCIEFYKIHLCVDLLAIHSFVLKV